MTVSPRYGAYPDALFTGLSAPVKYGHQREAGREGADAGEPSEQPALQHDTGLHDEHAPAQPSEVEGAAAGPGPSTDPSMVNFFLCKHKGVDHVFVDHPVFRSGPMELQHAGSAPAAEGVYTYTWGQAGVDIQARNNVLCQAALAAPVLLWLSANSDSSLQGQHMGHGSGLLAGPEHTPPVCRVGCAHRLVAGLARPVTFLSPLGWAQDPHNTGQDPCGCGPSEGAGAGRSSSSLGLFGAAGDEDVGELVFVGNDWPTGLLPLWLRSYVDLLEKGSSAAGQQDNQGPSQNRGAQALEGPTGARKRAAIAGEGLGRRCALLHVDACMWAPQQHCVPLQTASLHCVTD